MKKQDMELIMYHLVEVKTKNQKKEFLTLPALLYKVWEEKNWIGPLYKDTRNFFSPKKNPLLKEGESNRWLLYDVNKHLIGRIAAFYWRKSQEEEDVPTGHFGFFECTEDRKGAEYLFKAASEWLSAKGIKAMKGPFHLGGPGFFTGSLTRGFFEPVFGMPYNFSFYNDLFIEYGFKEILKSETYKIPLGDSPNWQFISKKTTNLYHDLRYRIETYEPKNCEKFSKDFTYIFNKTWTSVPGMAPMTLKRAMNRCRRLRPILVKKTILFLYFEDEPIAFLIAVPDIHQVIKKFKGKYNLIELLWLWLLVKVFKRITTLSGLIYGIVPGYEKHNPEAVLLDSFKELLKLYNLKFNELILSRIGDFAPGMKKITEQLGGEIYHQYITYQLLFDEVEKKK
ncbi:hypothetical protein MNBD_BACTEROID07-1961 [hydrothermal vent metagenome]|uniref:N-acetyltransferase domain-containing protein n=1 Tax=hydrothermal vent metagenome TaxID=652676 RepID=A0A3B0UH36_9ZZZZ